MTTTLRSLQATYELLWGLECALDAAIDSAVLVVELRERERELARVEDAQSAFIWAITRAKEGDLPGVLRQFGIYE